MLRIIAEHSTELLLRYDAIRPEMRRIYIYGFELFWSTALCVLSILAWGILMGVFGQSVVFLLFFMPVRVVAGGYHAESYGSCFILTNLIAGMNVIAAGILWHNRSWQTEALIMVLVILSWIYIYRRAPVTSERYPQKPERIAKNRRYAHAVIGIEAAAVAVMRAVFDTSLVYTAVIATCTVAVMIAITRKGGKRE